MVWLIVGGLILLMLVYSYFNTFRMVLREVEHTIPHKSGFGPLRILQLSDLHMERQSISPQRLRNLALATKPDLIVLTGDYLDRYHNIEKCVEYLKRVVTVNPKYGTYVVFGNHDHYLGERICELQAALEKIGCRVLCNESETIETEGAPLTVIGIDDHCLGKSDIPKSYQNVPSEGIHLVLAHDPNTILAMNESHPADYILSGHFHGGQFNLIPYLHRVMGFGELPKHDILKGMHRVNGKTIYISEGLGQSGLNVRLRSRPEITLHTLRTGRPDVAPAAAKTSETFAPALDGGY
ncbi:metallophosphoesterase [Effusibacillus dendaii]|uniref:Putative metallophosphoesterase YkoQ n=1 Tax=Effusibacillus dendaii TaxID=2743772 RepID=A0A7I8DGS8_9BACL|nr:metallophosphoesterase [Effusibacillus dendaii]BCJ87001.1 putative metallophosphoesterase YkoQ [Effusibacillus dendaii]